MLKLCNEEICGRRSFDYSALSRVISHRR